MGEQPVKNYAVFINLGTPADTRLFTIQKYLFEFLFDPCVIDLPFLSRLLLVGGIIVPIRSFNTRKSYQRIFTPEGSPLMVYSRKAVEEIQNLFSDQGASRISPLPEVILSMRYGEPSMDEAFKRFQSDIQSGHWVRVVFVPLYPQEAMSTTGTVIRKIERLIKKHNFGESLKYQIAPAFYHDEDYLNILATSIRPYVNHLDKESHVLFSYHGIPERHLTKFDPGKHCLSRPDCCTALGSEAERSHKFCYRHQVYKTTSQLAEKLGLRKEEYSLAFQSRLGRDPWLTPYTDKVVVELARRGVKKLLVVCPAFVSDNLETLFEIEIENQEFFREHGGESLTLIPCLNVREDWIGYLKKYAEKYFPN